LLATVAAALALAGPAAAKGPDQATVAGPGLDDGQITFASGGGDPGSGTPFAAFVDGTGFFPALFGQSPDPMLAERPSGDLGPVYRVTYRVPGPEGGTFTIRQELYPYAGSGPVTYTPPGQRIFDTTSRGGWFAAPPSFKQTLVAVGFPRSAPADADSGRWFEPVLDAWPYALVALAAAGGLALLLRRRPRLTAA